MHLCICSDASDITSIAHSTEDTLSKVIIMKMRPKRVFLAMKTENSLVLAANDGDNGSIVEL